MDIDNMPAGRDMDKLIAEKVFGWDDFWCNDRQLMGYPPCEQVSIMEAERHPVPYYSTDIAATWEVVEKVASLGCGYMVEDAEEGHICTFFKGFKFPRRIDEYEAEADTAPLAICRAALKAVQEC